MIRLSTINISLFALVLLLASSGLVAQTPHEKLDSLYKSKNYEEALRLADLNRELYLNPFDREAYVSSSIIKIKILLRKGSYDEIENIIEECLSFYPDPNNDRTIHYADLLLHKAKSYYDQRDREKCLQHLFKGEEALIGLNGAEKKLDQTYTFINEIYYQEGDYFQGLEWGAKHLKLIEEHYSHKDTKLAKVNYILGINLSQLDMPDSSAFHLKKAGMYWERSKGPDYPYLEYIYNELGQFAWDEGNFEEAFEHFSKAARFYSDDDTFDEISDGWLEKGNELTQSGNLDEAYDYFAKALEHRQKQLGPNSKATVGCYNSLIDLLIQKSNTEEAISMCQLAFSNQVVGFSPSDIYDNPEDISECVDFHYLFGIIQSKLKILSTYDINDRATSASCEELIELGFECLNQLQYGKRTSEIKRHWGAKAQEFFEVALDYYYRRSQNSSDNSFKVKAFEAMDRSKSFLLSEAIHGLEAGAISGVPKDVLDQERTLKEDIHNLQLLLSKESKKCEAADSTKVEKWHSDLANLKSKFSLFNFKLQDEYPEYYFLKYLPKTIKHEEIKELLDDDQMMIEYFVGDNYLYRICLEPSSIKFHRSGIDESFQQSVSDLYRSVSDQSFILNEPERSYNSFESNSSHLYKVLLGDLELSLKNKLIIIPDGVIYYLPFDLLITGKSEQGSPSFHNFEYLIETASISYSNSANLWLNNLSRSNIGQTSYMGIAPGYGDSFVQEEYYTELREELKPLKYNLNEVSSIRDLLGGTIISGEEATEYNFRSNVSNAGIIHLAMHTIVDRNDPLGSAFVFEHGDDSINDGFLFTSEIYNLKLNSELAILSACNTGYGELDKGEGLMSLSRAFAYAGCPSVVMSLWPCDDKSTKEIIGYFMSGVKNGEDKDIALRNAKIKYLAESSDAESNPFYWSHLSVNGSTKAIQFASFMDNWFWKAAGIISLFLILFYSISRIRAFTSSRRN